MHIFLVVIFIISNVVFAATHTSGPHLADIHTAELQWSLCEPAVDVLKKLSISEVRYKKKTQSYLDTSDFLLLKNDLQFRIREEQGSSKSALKKNFVNEEHVLPEMLDDKDTVCEYDYYMDLDKVGCKVSNKTSDPKKILSEKQRHFLRIFLPQNELDSLVQHGPFQYEQWEAAIPKSSQIMVIDNLKSKSGNNYYEISMIVSAEEREHQFKNWTDFFSTADVQICSKRVERTREVLLND